MQRTGPFGPPEGWPDDDLVAVSPGLDAELTLTAYEHGLFPMPLEGVMGWWSPVRRGVLPLDGLRVTRSLRKSLRRYEIRVDTAFAAVLDACGDPRRPGGWIDDDVRRVYLDLHDRGVTHSVEAWAPDAGDTSGPRLVGGLYGVNIGGLFAGESMFHDPEHGRDASKAALVALVALLAADGAPRLLDVQWRTEHLASLGVVELDRPDYLVRLRSALALPAPDWVSGPRG